MIEVGKFSGQVDDESGYIGVLLRDNEHVYARPIMLPPFLGFPDKNWVNNYGKYFQAVISYEMYDGVKIPERPILIGAIPLSKQYQAVDRMIYSEKDICVYANNEGVFAQTAQSKLSIDKEGIITIYAKNAVDIKTDSGSNISIDDGGINIDSGDNEVHINGPNPVLYSKIPGADEIGRASCRERVSSPV